MISLLQKIISFKKIAVVGVFHAADATRYHLMIVQRKGTTIDIIDQYNFTDYEALIAAIKFPALLLFDGKGILTRKVNLSNQSDLDWLKNIDHNTTYDTMLGSEQIRFISLARKTIIDHQVKQFLGSGLTV